MYICQCIHFIYKYKNLYKPYEFEVRSIPPKEPHILGTKSWGVTSVTQKTRQLVASIVKLAETETTFARSIRWHLCIHIYIYIYMIHHDSSNPKNIKKQNPIYIYILKSWRMPFLSFLGDCFVDLCPFADDLHPSSERRPETGRRDASHGSTRRLQSQPVWWRESSPPRSACHG